jgi:hypothetical protein
LSFMLVYLLLIRHLIRDFKTLKFNKSDILTILGVVILITYLSITILSLQFEKMKTDFSIIIIYSVVLSVLICISVVSYIARSSYAFLNLVLMATCFMLSDIFYVLNGFYLRLSAFSLIEMASQVFSYFFMVNYFIENDKFMKRLNDN